MNSNEIANVTKQQATNLKLAPAELASFPGYDALSTDKQDGLRDFVYNLSVVLYKTFEDEKS